MESVFGIRGGGTGPDGGAFLEICFFRFWRTEDDPGALGLGGSALVVVGTLTGDVDWTRDPCPPGGLQASEAEGGAGACDLA